MSGGSFDYLCEKDGEELHVYYVLSLLQQMADALGEYPDGEAASLDTHELVAMIKTTKRRVEARRRRLAEVWHAVEWHHSNDGTADQVATALKAYYDGKPEAP